MKSRVTPLAVSTGRNGPEGAPTFSPRRPPTNSAAAPLSRAATMVWFSWTDMACSPRRHRAGMPDLPVPFQVVPTRAPAPAGRQDGEGAHTADLSRSAGRGGGRPHRGVGP